MGASNTTVKVEDLKPLLGSFADVIEKITKVLDSQSYDSRKGSVKASDIVCEVKESSLEEFEHYKYHAQDKGKRAFYVPKFLEFDDVVIVIGNGDGAYFKILIKRG